MRTPPWLIFALSCIVLLSGGPSAAYQTRFPTVGGAQTVPAPAYNSAGPITPGAASYGNTAPLFQGPTAPPSLNAGVAPYGGTGSLSPGAAGTPSFNTGTTPYSAPGALSSGGAAAPSFGAGASTGTATLPPDMTPVTPGQVPGPMPSYGGVVGTPAPTWDPYAPAGSTPPPTVLPQDYYPPAPTAQDLGKLQRLIDEIRVDYHLLAPRGSKKFGTNDLELTTTFAFPLFYNKERPLLVTPGFAFHWWEGPTGPDLPPGLLSDLPPRVYDAYLDAAWKPQITPQVGGDLAFRVGVYSDFEKVTEKALRYTGHGLFVLSLSPSFKVEAGIVYLDRVRIKMLPAGGIVWTPMPDTEFFLVFPYPRIARRLSNYGNTEWWLYCRGEYGGGSWEVNSVAPPEDQVDYNDIRVALGLEFNRMDRIGGLIEVGTAFERELIVRSTGDKYSPSTTIFLRAGLLR